MRNIFVGNLSFQTTESDLRTAFEAFGEIARIQIMTDRDTGQARGFAFVEMATDQEAASAIAGMNGRELDGRALNVNEAKPKTTGGGGGGSRGGNGGGYSKDRGGYSKDRGSRY